MESAVRGRGPDVRSNGRLTVTGRATDRLGDDGNQLTFKIGGLDQSYLQGIIDGLVEIEAFFPVVGRPGLTASGKTCLPVTPVDDQGGAGTDLADRGDRSRRLFSFGDRSDD